MVEAWLRIPNMDMLNAIQKANESLGLVTVDESPPVPTPADNERALAELSKMMGGVR